VRNVDHFDLFDSQTDDLANGCRGERFESAGNGRLPIEHVRRQNLSGEFFFTELFAQLQILDGIEKLDDLLIGPITQGSEKSCSQKFPAAFPTIEIDIKQIGGIELDPDP